MAFRTPQDILDFHDGRRIAPTFSWNDVTSHERAHLFTVAKATDPVLLDVLKTSMGDALRAGWSCPTWHKALLPRLASIGWDRPRQVDDPLGMRSPRTVDFTDPDRLELAFWAGMAVPRSARQFQAARRTATALPYVVYCGPAPVSSCKGHSGWTGLVLPIDHSWWRRHWPPNAWGCTCSVRQITARERDRLLIQDATSGRSSYRTLAPDESGPCADVTLRTGSVVTVPVGLAFGWDGNPAIDREHPLSDVPVRGRHIPIRGSGCSLT